MNHFTPVSAVAGGVLIGGAASLLWITTGRIAGISGIAGGLLAGPRGEAGWRLAFLAGLVAAPLALGLFVAPHPAFIAAGPLRLVVAGLLVGFGTRLGGGCTSGHGVCGMARGSRRSVVATCIFVGVAMLTVFLSGIFGSQAAP